MENTSTQQATPVDIETLAAQKAGAFSLLPEAIRVWLTSDQVVDTVTLLNDKNHIPPGKLRIIPRDITRLVVGIIQPKEFVDQLKKDLGLPVEITQKIAAEIKGKILNPIAVALKNTTGIDISFIPVEAIGGEKIPPIGAPTPAQPLQPAQTPTSTPTSTVPVAPVQPGPEQPKARVISFSNNVAVSRPAPTPTSPTPTPVAPTQPTANVVSMKKPFMLHEEKPVAPLSQPTRESFSFRVQPQAEVPKGPRPAPAQFISPFESSMKKPVAPQTAKTAGPEIPKIVHYTTQRTPLDEKTNEKQQPKF